MTIRFGLVGCGRIGATGDDRARAWPHAHLWLPYSHASAIGATPGAELAAVCDVRADAAEAAKARHGAGAAYTDHRAMLAAERLDVLAVATRTQERKAVLAAGLAAGVRGLYCEKPLSNSLEDADALAAEVTARGAEFMYGTRRRFMPLFQELRERVRAGELGRLERIVARLGHGPLFWAHPHSVDLLSFFADDAPVASVQADLALDPGDVRGGVIDADPIVRVANIRFESGVGGVILDGSGVDLQLVGTRGIAIVEGDGHRTRVRRARADGSDAGLFIDAEEAPAPGPSSGTVRSLEALTRAVSLGADPGYSIAHAVRNQEILFAMVESELRSGARVPFPVARRGLVITGRSGTMFA